jgi:uncharacterized protein YecE (DUF72 family)
MPKAFIGTSGWAYKEWGEKFFPKEVPRRDHLRYLASRFNTVEINSTFYRLQPEHNYLKWDDETPPGFQFAIKVSRFITHRKEPIDITEPWRRLAEPTDLLGPKCGPFLFQFPPSFRLNAVWLDWLDSVLPQIKKERPGLRIAMEFRHKEAFRDEALARLADHKVALVVANSSRFPTGPHAGWADFAYFRFHGPRDLFASDYSADELKPWAGRVQNELAAGKDIYAYFNNDFHAYAPGNAELLVDLLN